MRAFAYENIIYYRRASPSARSSRVGGRDKGSRQDEARVQDPDRVRNANGRIIRLTFSLCRRPINVKLGTSLARRTVAVQTAGRSLRTGGAD